MNPSTSIDAARCEALVVRAAAGDTEACRTLVELLWPMWVQAARSSRTMGAYARSEDHVHNVVTGLVEKIGRPDGRGVRLYAPWREQNADKTFADWIRIVTANAIRDYVRRQKSEATAGVVPGEMSAKRLLNEFATSHALEGLGVRPPMTDVQTARELIEYARARLPADSVRALDLWMGGAEFAEIEADLGLAGEDSARRLVRAAIAVLRRHYGDSASDR